MGIFPHQHVYQQRALVGALYAGVSIKADVYIIAYAIYINNYGSRRFVGELTSEICDHAAKIKEAITETLETREKGLIDSWLQ